MQPKFEADTSQFESLMKRLKPTAGDLREIAAPGVIVIQNYQVVEVPKLTGATAASIRPHTVISTNQRYETDIGPETDYAPAIEYGRPDMKNYPIQPFVRPSIYGQEAQIQAAVTMGFRYFVESRS